jgi:hypothetical protein
MISTFVLYCANGSGETFISISRRYVVRIVSGRELMIGHSRQEGYELIHYKSTRYYFCLKVRVNVAFFVCAVSIFVRDK